jgi:hypothetical protein
MDFDTMVNLAVYWQFAGLGLDGDFWDPQSDRFG